MAEIIFQPVRGTQAQINREPIQEGYVYYAYDSGRIYLDKNGNRYLMSNKAGGGGGAGGTGIIYANGNDRQIIPEDLTEREPTIFIMDLEALEDQQLPEVDNLILNSDGRFFRVIGVDEYTSKITVKLLAVSGSGGGGGGGGQSSEPDVNISWDSDTIATGRIYIYGQQYNAVFTPVTTAPGDINCNVTFNIINNDNNTTETIVKNNVPSGLPFNFDTSVLPESSNITLQVIVTSDNSQYNYGLGYQRNITGLRVVRMELIKPNENAYSPIVKPDDLSGQLNLSIMPIGDESLSLVLHTYIDGEELPRTMNIPASYLGKTVPIVIERQEHGVHKISFKLSADLGGTTVYSNAIEYEGAWASSGIDDPIIWIGKYDDLIVNYENSYIYYMVYDPVSYSNGMPAEVHLYKEGIEISQVDGMYSDDGWLVWDISNIYTVEENTEVTANHFAIACGSTRVTVTVNVTTKGSRDLGLVAPSNLILNMSSAGRSSNEIKRNRTVFKSTVRTSDITATLNNFNWQNNGWKDTEGVDKNGVDSGSYLSIANGASLTVSMAGNGLILNGAKDYSFEFRFRVRNVQEYSTLVKVIPKYFYDVPLTDDQNNIIYDEDGNVTWIPTYTITVKGEDEEIAGPSLLEEQIEELGYRIGLDKYGNLLMDEENSLKSTETRKGVICRWLEPNKENPCGLCIGTQEAYFRTPSGVANVRYCEDEVINLTIVASKTDSLCYVYLNGILSGAVKMPAGTGAQFTINTPFEFNSEYCDVDLYRFRIYELGLSMPNVIHNYLSDMHSIVLYDQNQITDPLDPTSLSYAELMKYNAAHPDAPSMPYATWQITDGTDEMLSYKKGNKRKTTVEFVNPSLDRALMLYLDGDTENGITPWHYYTHSPSFMANDVELNVQGTSSQKYPRRNYKLAYKKAKNWVYTQGPLAGCLLTNTYYFYKSNGQLVTVEQVNSETGETEIVPLTDKNQYNSETMNSLAKNFHMDTETFGTNKFTWKIDYMESSGSYNTGFANLMGNLVHPLYTKHPLDDYNLGINTNDMRTTVYGFPVLVFHKYSSGDYEYVGRYNMNLDKGSNEYYGFEDKAKQPYVPRRTKKVQNEETGIWEDVEYQPTIAEIAECWELKDNQGNWCSFKYPNDEARQTGFMTLKEGTSDETAQLEILNHFEYRYSFYGDELDAAYDYTAFTDTNTQVEYTNNGQINTYLYEKHSNLEKVFNWLDSTNPDTATNETLENPVVYQVSSTSDDPTVTYTLVSAGLWNAEFTKDTREYRRQKFRAELTQHFDKEYCLTYYVLTELLLCYDSRGKNLMMASFGPQRVGGEYIWYPIFYDIDTQLGLNNSGAYLWDYDADVTKDNLFSTPTSVLWNNLYDLFYDDIVSKYRVLRGVSQPSSADAKINGSLTYENIAGAYECNPDVFQSYAMRGVRPIVAIGLDEYYKYLAPALKETDYNAGKLYAGYYDTSGTHKYQATPTYVYTCQGDKKLTTELLLRNRLNYIDSWWMGGDYRAGVVENQIFLRGNANLASTSDNYLDSNSMNELPAAAIQSAASYILAPYNDDGEIRNINDYFDAKPGFKIKPFLHQYVSYFHDSQPSQPKKYDGSAGQENGVWTNVDSGKREAYKTEVDYSQQILYVPGGDYISSLGDLSLVYANAIQIQHGQRLLDLKLGSDIPGYKNPGLTGRQNTDFEFTKMPLLKSVNISKLNRLNDELPELKDSEKLQEFRALGSAIERTNFASGAPLHTVHLPASMTTLSFVQNQNLKNILTSPPEVVTYNNETGLYDYNDPATYRGLYIEGITDYNSNLEFDPNTGGQKEIDENKGHNVSTYEVKGGGLGYNSYTILRNLYMLKHNAPTNNLLSIGLTDVQWTPYIAVEKGTPYDSNETYYYLNDHSTFESYTKPNGTAGDADWEDKLKNSLIYIWDTDCTVADTSKITDLSLLDKLIEQYEDAKTNGHSSQFSNLVATTEATIPTITGSMYINNDPGAILGSTTSEIDNSSFKVNVRMKEDNSRHQYKNSDKITVYQSNNKVTLVGKLSELEAYTYGDLQVLRKYLFPVFVTNVDLTNLVVTVYTRSEAPDFVYSDFITDGLSTNEFMLPPLYFCADEGQDYSLGAQPRYIAFTNNETGETISMSMYLIDEDVIAPKIKETDFTEIYAKYFPYLQITAANVKASNVTKYVRVFEDSGIVDTIEALRSDDVHPLAPTKSIPLKAGYDFIGWSTDAAGTQIFLRYELDVNTGSGSYVNVQNTLNSYTFSEQNTVLTLYAQYQIHQNIITIYSAGERVGAALVSNGSTFRNPTRIYKYVNDLIDTSVAYDYVPYRSDASLPLTSTYKFNGYSSNPLDTTEVTLPPPEIITKDITIYATFVEDSVYNNVLSNDYLTCVAYGQDTVVMSFNTTALQGKVTLPAVWTNPETNEQFTPNQFTSGSFNENITHIFWETGTQVTVLQTGAFSPPNNSIIPKLVYVEPPCDETILGDRCFMNCKNIFNNSSITEDLVTGFFSQIKDIGGQAFSGTHASWPNNPEDYGGFRNKTLYLPASIIHIGSRAFNQCFIKAIQLGNVGHPFSYDSLYYGNQNGIFYSGSKYNEITGQSEPLDITVYWDDYNRDEAGWILRLVGRTPDQCVDNIHFVDA